MALIVTDPGSAARALADLVCAADVITGFTGAGISTECGVPDFRSPGSPWMANKPIPYAAFTASAEARREAWRRKFVMDDTYAGAKPGRGHAALTALHRAGKMPVLITQNIDGLHQQAGLPADAVMELHGNGTYARCLACGVRHELEHIRPHFEREGDAPPCGSCGGILKSATVSFGQPMPGAEMRKATQAALASDLFVAIGSSLVVYPAADLPQVAHANGSRLVIINRQDTNLDSRADLVIRADIGEVLSALIVVLDL
jgi:NAD-dependent deacetylase